MTTPRNALCPCGSGKKYKKCCLLPDDNRRARSVERRIVGERRDVVVGGRDRPERLPDARAWPVRRVLLPVPDVWRASGMGTVAVARERPDGRIAYAAFMLNVAKHGITGVFGKPDAPAGSEGSLLDDMADLIPSMQDGALADAAALVHGALALADAHGAGFPTDELAPYLDLLPAPSVDPRNDLIERTPAGLLRLVSELPVDDIEDGKAIAVATEMAFRISSPSELTASAKFRFADEEDGVRHFDYTPVPLGTRSRVGVPGKVQGEAWLGGDRIEALAFTLSMAARLVADLREWLGPNIELLVVRWTSSFTGRREMEPEGSSRSPVGTPFLVDDRPTLRGAVE